MGMNSHGKTVEGTCSDSHTIQKNDTASEKDNSEDHFSGGCPSTVTTIVTRGNMGSKQKAQQSQMPKVVHRSYPKQKPP